MDLVALGKRRVGLYSIFLCLLGDYPSIKYVLIDAPYCHRAIAIDSFRAGVSRSGKCRNTDQNRIIEAILTLFYLPRNAARIC